ncbi:hypothetical protein U9M48_020467 [Paspalum notatum var. saurae]|uniref:Uncharacterized protein n=1 Tax=Paspalum notatum var. saurae TaxID=547442 RepID=A0AAQ3TDE8_PASNO
MPRANEMFRADSRMMVVFGTLTSKPKQLTFEESLRFVKKVKLNDTPYNSLKAIVIARDYMLYLSLFDILGRMEFSQLDAYRELQLLFQNHPDLCEELEKFRPPVPVKHATNNIWPWVIVCAVPLVAVSLIPALGNPVLWFVQQTIGEKMTA